jgi:hypothetical protein
VVCSRSEGRIVTARVTKVSYGILRLVGFNLAEAGLDRPAGLSADRARQRRGEPGCARLCVIGDCDSL